MAYLTAYYALVVRGQIRPGQRVLIHAGSGGVGQAAIAVALDAGCDVYTTVSTDEKREFLKKRFPKLEDNCFANSRDTSFEDHILRATDGYGVDLVLNSLAGDQLHASLAVLAAHGKFLEIGKYDLSADSKLGVLIFIKANEHFLLMNLYKVNCVGVKVARFDPFLCFAKRLSHNCVKRFGRFTRFCQPGKNN